MQWHGEPMNPQVARVVGALLSRIQRPRKVLGGSFFASAREPGSELALKHAAY
jgi:hypothetical protein